MRSDVHPAARRITWLMIIVGAIAVLIAFAYWLFNVGPGVMLPFTRTAFDVGWLFMFGLLWLAVGLLFLWWLRPTAGESEGSEHIRLPAKQTAQFEAALDPRLADINAR